MHLAAPAPKPAIVSRIKIMAGMDIAERRLPQDGRIELNVSGAIDLRVSILPTIFGEKAVMRVLDRGTSASTSTARACAGRPGTFRQLIRKPYGIVLVTGPTGSGKTTTLYSALHEINDSDQEHHHGRGPGRIPPPGHQPDSGQRRDRITFAPVLRTLLRQDPDIILVGEIRDLETAEVAIQAALTGHLVFATLHTNDAPTPSPGSTTWGSSRSCCPRRWC